MLWKRFTVVLGVLILLYTSGCGIADRYLNGSGTNKPPVNPKPSGETPVPGQAGSDRLDYVSEISLLKEGIQLHTIDYSPGGSTFLSPDGRFLALSGTRFSPQIEVEPESQLLLINLTDGNVKILDSGSVIRIIEWSPSGDKLLYRKFESLMVVDADGGKPVEISSRAYHGSISPDGTKIAYAGIDEGISLINLDGSGKKQLTREKGDWYPIWYPDGKNLFYFADRGVTLGDGAGQLQGLGKINIDSGKTETLVPAEKGKYRWAKWVTKNTLLINKGWDDGNFELVVNLDTGKVQDLGENYSYGEYSTTIDKTNGLVYKAQKDRVAATDSDGREVRSFSFKKPVEDPGLMNYAYSVSPDGKLLAYLFGQPGFSDGGKVEGRKPYLVDLTGAAPRELTGDYGDYHEPVWTPDGKHLVIVQTDGGRGEQFIVKLLTIANR